MNIKVNTDNTGLPANLIIEQRELAQKKLSVLWSDDSEFKQYTGWLEYPNKITEAEIEAIKRLADEIRRTSDILLVIGVGGSYLGAKAVIDLIGSDHGAPTEIIFLGFDFNARYLESVFNKINDCDFSVCVISKSGGTIEPMAAFAIAEEKLLAKYGKEEAVSRTYVITENKNNPLHNYANKIKCNIIHMPIDIGGRYSVFTPVGLLPLAVKGIDISEFILGARELANREAFAEDGLDYAIARFLFGQTNIGKSVEVFEFFDQYGEFFGNWLQQLFGESEGKDGKGIFPSVLVFNRDLHSMGQFLQQGSPTFFETMLMLGREQSDLTIPDTELLPELSGKKIADISSYVEQGVFEAHRKAGIPIITISVEETTPRLVGELMYYFMVQCAVSAMLIEVNPFDQPGVENYKSEVKALIEDK